MLQKKFKLKRKAAINVGERSLDSENGTTYKIRVQVEHYYKNVFRTNEKEQTY